MVVTKPLALEVEMAGVSRAVYVPRERTTRKKRDKIEFVDVDKIWLGLNGDPLMIQ